MRSSNKKTIPALILIGSFLSGCITHPQRTEGVPPSPNARLYTFLIAHGMVRGALITGRISPQNIQNVIILDHGAEQTALQAAQKQTPSAVKKADLSVEKLLNVISINK
ncbi:hypothetical protein [Swingsia samuiensis]|uniref:Uncharacterized protein n=1 Tax=Swingsia samuiensis TaxID=1293412 RepID=A0A4Y6UND6_9PROT|nr:hypothetical protein [Swingsia samuiensis]QDH17891.1 hypothetical protein E3D00_10145 [Swingsia samuiensis]